MTFIADWKQFILTINLLLKAFEKRIDSNWNSITQQRRW